MAGVFLGITLAVISAWGIVSSSRLSAAIHSASVSVGLSDQAQTLRYQLAEEETARRAYVQGRVRATAAALQTAATTVDATLAAMLQAVPADDGRRGLVVATMLAHARAVAGSGAEVDPVDAQVQALDRAADTLLRVTRQVARDQLAQNARTSDFLRDSTPVVLFIGIGLVGLVGRVNRGYRRTIERQGLHDPLTGLPNRVLFTDRAEQALAASARGDVQLAVLVLDLDGFKDVNDTLGHPMGDQLLVQTAARINGVLRPSDTVARIGGDEFAVLLPQAVEGIAREVAARILATLEQPFVLEGISVGVEASIGIALHDDAALGTRVPAGVLAATVVDLLRHADSAMFAAKSDRLGYAMYDATADDPLPSRLAALGELRRALDRDELVVHYQPKVGTDLGNLVGLEALVRWQHPTRGLLPPGEFVGLAESTTLVHRLTAVVLDKALHVVADWLDRGFEIPVAVNVSARCLLDADFPGVVRRLLEEAGVPPRLLCLELTESVIMGDPERSLAALRELRGLGVRLSVDDYGTGYSSMAYLKNLPVDELKVDRTFVSDMASNARNAVLVLSAIDLGHNLGLSVVAEGVEDRSTYDLLATAGADVVQGFFVGRPMDAQRLVSWVEQRPELLASTTSLDEF